MLSPPQGKRGSGGYNTEEEEEEEARSRRASGEGGSGSGKKARGVGGHGGAAQRLPPSHGMTQRGLHGGVYKHKVLLGPRCFEHLVSNFDREPGQKFEKIANPDPLAAVTRLAQGRECALVFYNAGTRLAFFQ